MNLRKSIIKTVSEYLNEQEESNSDIPKPNDDFLYHGTNIRNLDDIQKYGLIPDFGKTVRKTSVAQYYFDDEYTNPDNRVKGVVFFSDNPDTWTYSNYGKKPDIRKAVLVIVEKNDTIFRKLGEDIYDMDGNKVDRVKYTHVNYLPPFIENGDYFSLEEQEPLDILYGERLVKFLKQFS